MGMKNIFLNIPKDLQRRDLTFELNKSNYKINRDIFPHDIVTEGINYYTYTILNRTIILTLFEDKNVIK